MLVSIVIPCWRQARFLPTSVGSALAQTDAAVETIVVNDGSDDDTAAVAASFAPRVRYVEKRNGGLASARNAGLAAAEGDACLFLDADDALAPGAVARLVGAAGADGLAVGGYRTFRDDPSEAGGAERLPPEAAEPFPHLVRDNFGPPHAYLAPTALLLRLGGFDETMPTGCEDWDAWSRLAFAGAPFSAVRRVVALYRDTPGSMSKSLPRMLRSRAEVLLRQHAAMAADPALRARCAADLIASARRVLRRIHAQALGEATLAARLRSLVGDLEALGHRAPAGRRERIERAIFGAGADRAHVAFCRAFRRDWLEFYRAGYV